MSGDTALAKAWDEGWRAAHTMLPTDPPRYPTNPYRSDSGVDGTDVEETGVEDYRLAWQEAEDEAERLREALQAVSTERDSLRFELYGARSVAKGDKEYLLRRATEAERALGATRAELAEVRHQRDRAEGIAEARGEALDTLESRILNLADLYDEGGRTRTPRPTWHELAMEIRRNVAGDR